MSIGGFMDSASTATDSRIAATDQARVIKGNVGQSVESGAVGVATGGTLLGSGAKQTTIKNTGKGTVTVQSMDPEVAQQAMDQISGMAGLFSQQLSDVVTQANNQALASAAAQAQQTQADQAALAKLVSDQQPAGTALETKTVLYIALGVLALVAVIFYIWRK